MPRHLISLVLLAFVCWVGFTSATHSQRRDDAALNAEVLRLHQAGKYAEATEVAKRLLTIYEREFGPKHPYVATSLYTLAELYWRQGRYAEAEPLSKLSLTIREEA